MNKSVTEFNLPNAEIIYVADFYTKEEANDLFCVLLQEINWQQDSIKMFGKTHKVPRLQAFYGDKGFDYSYSNIKLKTNPWTATLTHIKTQVENFCKHTFTSVLANLYRNGKDSNGWHADDEPELGQNPVIASLSLGAVRNFHLKNKKDKTIKQKIELANGSLLLMKGCTQHFYHHQLAKTAKKVENRINLTFRKIALFPFL